MCTVISCYNPGIALKLVAFQGLATPPSDGDTMGAGAIRHHRPAAARPAMRLGATASRGSGARDRLRFWVSNGAGSSPLGGWGTCVETSALGGGNLTTSLK